MTGTLPACDLLAATADPLFAILCGLLALLLLTAIAAGFALLRRGAPANIPAQAWSGHGRQPMSAGGQAGVWRLDHQLGVAARGRDEPALAYLLGKALVYTGIGVTVIPIGREFSLG